jgi:hypothetical protein
MKTGKDELSEETVDRITDSVSPLLKKLRSYFRKYWKVITALLLSFINYVTALTNPELSYSIPTFYDAMEIPVAFFSLLIFLIGSFMVWWLILSFLQFLYMAHKYNVKLEKKEKQKRKPKQLI